MVGDRERERERTYVVGDWERETIVIIDVW